MGENSACVIIRKVGCIVLLVDNFNCSVLAVKLIPNRVTVRKGNDVVFHISIVRIEGCIAVCIGDRNLLIVAIVDCYNGFTVCINGTKQIPTFIVFILSYFVICINF